MQNSIYFLHGFDGLERLCGLTGTVFGPGFAVVLTFRVLHPINIDFIDPRLGLGSG